MLKPGLWSLKNAGVVNALQKGKRENLVLAHKQHAHQSNFTSQGTGNAWAFPSEPSTVQQSGLQDYVHRFSDHLMGCQEDLQGFQSIGMDTCNALTISQNLIICLDGFEAIG